MDEASAAFFYGLAWGFLLGALTSLIILPLE